MHDSQKLAELVETMDREVYADNAYRSAEAEAMLAQKQVTSRIHQRAYRNRPLNERRAESKQPVEVQDSGAHRTCLRFHEPVVERILSASIGQRRNAAIGLINNLARYEQIVRLKPLPRTAACKAKIKTKNDRKPINDKGANVMKIQTEDAVWKPSTPKTELQPSTQLRKAVFGGFSYKKLLLDMGMLVAIY